MSAAATKGHVIAFGKWMPGQEFAADGNGDKPLTIKSASVAG